MFSRSNVLFLGISLRTVRFNPFELVNPPEPDDVLWLCTRDLQHDLSTTHRTSKERHRVPCAHEIDTANAELSYRDRRCQEEKPCEYIYLKQHSEFLLFCELRPMRPRRYAEQKYERDIGESKV